MALTVANNTKKRLTTSELMLHHSGVQLHKTLGNNQQQA
jgi:hypothetical protein